MLLWRPRLKAEAELHDDGSVHVTQTQQEKASLVVYAKILTSHFQILMQFRIVMEIEFPARFEQMLAYLQWLKGDFVTYFNVKCALKLNLYTEFYIVIAILPVAFMIGLAVNALNAWRRQHQATQRPSADDKVSESELSERLGGDPFETEVVTEQLAADDNPADAATQRFHCLLNKMFILVFLTYPFITMRIFHMFGCRPLYVDGGEGLQKTESWHRYDYNIDCLGPVYLDFAFVAKVMVVVYPIGIPLFCFWMFYMNRDRLKDTSSLGAGPQVGNEGTSPEEPESPFVWMEPPKTVALPWWHGDRTVFFFMVRDYKPQYYYFEVVDLGRKLGLTGILMLFTPGSVMQIFVGITIAFGFAALNAVVRPFDDPRANAMRMTADTSLFFTLLCILIIHFQASLDECDLMQPDVIGWFLILANFALLILFVCWEYAARAIRMYSESMFVGISYRPDAPLNMRIDTEFSTGEVQTTNSSASVYRGEYKATASASTVPCAVKIRARSHDNLVLEIENAIMLQCNHPNIVRLYHLEEDTTKYYLCSELCSSSIEMAVQRGQVESVEARIELSRLMIEGVGAFHEHGFIHGNITPSNFVLGHDGVPRLCGFSNTSMLNHSAVATKLDTMGGSVGYMPSEVMNGRKIHVVVEVLRPQAVDVFSLGVTLCFVLANGKLPFQGGSTVERNIQTGAHGVDDIHRLPAEAKHLISLMLRFSPAGRPPGPPVEFVAKHPLFWSLAAKITYLGLTIGAPLLARVQKTKHAFIAELEQLADKELGPYNEDAPEKGGSWAGSLDARYPLGGDWGKTQRPPEEEERFYHLYGAPPSKKQAKEREALIADGKPLGAHVSKEIRTVGLLKFIRNLNVHAEQQVVTGRFESVEHLHQYLISPFPWLLIGVYVADAKHSFSGGDAKADGMGPVAISIDGKRTTVDAEPMGDPTVDTTANPVGSEAGPFIRSTDSEDGGGWGGGMVVGGATAL